MADLETIAAMLTGPISNTKAQPYTDADIDIHVQTYLRISIHLLETEKRNLEQRKASQEKPGIIGFYDKL